MKRLIFLLFLLLPLMAVAQEPDSAQLVMDSLKRELQELRLKEIIMQHALDSTGQSAREDSLRLVRRKMHIDSLKSITPGVPVIVEKDTLFILYASLGGEGPVHRAEDITYKILQLGKSLRTTTDTLTVFNSELTSDVMSGQFVLVPVSDLDGLWAGMSRQELAHVYMGIIDKKIKKMQAEYGLQAKLRGMTWAAALIVLQIVFFVLTARFTGWMRKEIMDGLRGRMKPLVVKGYELLFVVNENDEPEDGGNLLQQMWNQVMTSKSQISVYGKVEKNVVDGVLLRWDIWNQVVLGHLDGKMKVEILSKALSLDGGLVEIDRNEDDVVDMKKVLKEVEAGNVLFVMDGEEHPELHSVNEAKAYMDSINFHHSHETWIVGGGVKEKYPHTDKKVVIEWERSEADKMSDAELKEAVMNCVVLINGEYRPEFHNENEVIKYLSDEDGAFNVPDYRVNIHFNQEKAAKYDKTKKVVTEITYTEKKKDE